jgi:hypothetical protein
MVSVLVQYAIEATPIAVILYVVAWRVMGKPEGHQDRLRPTWHFIGAALVAIGAGVIRVATAYVLGGQAMLDLWTNSGVGLIGPVGVPALLSICVVALLRAKARRASPRV